MAITIPVEHCPTVDLVALPSKDVTTNDGHPVKLGSIVYFRFNPGPSAAEYAVISSHALKVVDGYKVAVIGPRGFPGWLNVKDLVRDKAEWWALYQKQYAPTIQKEEVDISPKPPRKRKSG